MKAKVVLLVILAGVALALAIAFFVRPVQPHSLEPQQIETASPSQRQEQPPTPTVSAPALMPLRAPVSKIASASAPPDPTVASASKLERLDQTRASVLNLASGDPAIALRAAKQITDENERETALLTLVTEWTQGVLGPPGQRAQAIANYGLEAGLGLELVSHPELAVLWANEMVEPAGRAAMLQQVAITLLNSDPAAAFALSSQVPEADRRKFSDAVFAGWGTRDTDAALQWADQLPDAAERDAALSAIRSVAPVGIGAALSVQDGYAVINQILPGTPAELSGQLRAGDRIVALAQGNNSFVDAHSLSLQDIVQLVRGAPGTLLQLQVLSADAPPDASPRTVPIIRDQVKFKRSSP